MNSCPCGSKQAYASCCEPYIQNKQHPSTPELLMRSRYTAYCLANIDYIKATMRKKAALGFDEHDASRWSKRVTWINLKVINTEMDDLNKGYVEFIATFVDISVLKSIHEKSEFIKENGQWYYVDGIQYGNGTSVRQIISRNTQCPCDSQRKYKNCHGKS